MSNNLPQDCAVMISTCDAYSDIWEPFFTLFSKFWPDNPYPVYVNSETLDCVNDKVSVTTLKARSRDVAWTRRLKEALERIDAEYIIFFLDDFFLYDYVDTIKVEECISFMREDSDMVAIYFTWLGGRMKMEDCKLPGLEKCSHTGKSKVNITLTIWRKSAFEFYLNSDETAWEFEANSLERSLKRKDTFYTFSKSAAAAMPYNFEKYGLFAGKWFKSTVDLFLKNGIACDFSERGFYEEYEFALIPYVARQIEMNSYLVPNYSLNCDNPRINTECIVKEGHFFQTYDVKGAKNAAIWHPSILYGHVIENFTCTITFKSGVTQTLTSDDVYGNFMMIRGLMYFLVPHGTHVYIFSKTDQEMSQITIEGYMNKHLNRDDLATAFAMGVRTIPQNLHFVADEVWLEHLLIPENCEPLRVSSRLCLKIDNDYSENNAISDSKDRFPGSFQQIYEIHKTCNQMVAWCAEATLGGFAIKNLSVELRYYANKHSVFLGMEHISSDDGIYIGAENDYWVFLNTCYKMNFSLPEDLPDEIKISGTLMAPMPRKVLKSAVEQLKLRETLQGQNNTIAQLNNTIAQLNGTIAELNDAATWLRREIDAIHASKSWRLGNSIVKTAAKIIPSKK